MDLRRVPARDADVPSDPVLLDAIRTEIRAAGPMTFARFMEIALYTPERGYYRAAAERPGRIGDFLTAPEASPIFGRALARFARGVHAVLGAPPGLTIREHGAGGGALAAPLVEALLADPDGPRTVEYLVAEVESARVGAVRARIAATDADPGRVKVAADDGRPIDGLVLANEVLDALPTHRVVARAGALREILVGLDEAGDLVDVEAEPSTPGIAARLAAEGVTLLDDQRTEVCLAIDAWVAAAAAGLRRGALLVIDYGHPAADLHDPRRRAAGTLATYLGHTVGEDPFRAIGRQDLTAHVDVTAVEQAAAAAGLTLAGTTTQARFLERLGAGELLVAEQTRPGATLASYLETRSALVRMIDPGAMGGFRVLAWTRGLPPDMPLPGLDQAADPTGAPRRPGTPPVGPD
jgi:SAM-dependent MidA family methyltransferase